MSALNTLSLALLAVFFGKSMGHMIMVSPVPFSRDSLNNSPLVDAKPGTAQSDYPCKIRSNMWKIGQMNQMTVDTPQLLNFTGSASHGGGTCQVAVTLDKQPDHTSTFKVIQVFEGGCPTSGDGNDGSHPFSYSVPKGFPNGQATLAWVWYNKVGNREVYMNCAPIEVSGGSDSKDVYNALPNLYLINLPTSECSSVETSDQEIPHPGQYVLKGSSATISAATGPSCAASAAAQTASVGGYKSAVINDGGAYSAPAAGGSASGEQVSGSSAALPTAHAISSSSSSPAEPTADPSSSVAEAASSMIISIPSASASSTPTAYPTMSISSNAGINGPASTAASAAAPIGTASSSGGSCSGEAMMCNSEGTQFGLCANGEAVWQIVAPGTKCVNGSIQKRSDFRHAHIRRHWQNAASGFH